MDRALHVLLVPLLLLPLLLLPSLCAGGAAFDRPTMFQQPGEDSSLFNVKDYGAKGDGVTDDTTSVQTAIEAAANATVVFELPDWHDAIFSTSTVVFPSGHYVRHSMVQLE